MKVLLGIPIDGEAIVGTTDLTWADECQNILGIVTNRVVLKGQRIQINRLLEKVDQGLLDGAAEVVVHQYARCYILALLADTIFADKSGDRVHTMWLHMLRDLRNPPVQLGEHLPCIVVQRVMQGNRQRCQSDWWGFATGSVLGMVQIPFFVPKEGPPTR